ncbi:MAG: SURF1 family protein [Pseudomonadota bacterium]
MTSPLQPDATAGNRRRGLRWGWALCALLLFAAFVALGSWQLQRRIWKLDLIERVNQRVAAPAVPAPAPADWPKLSAASHEYRHVQLTGRFIAGSDTRVQAVTKIGAGFWLLSALQQADGSVVLVNRGFVASQSKAVSAASEAPVTITGLLRLTEPGGGFLRNNDPAGNRWFSRDVAAIAQAQGLGKVAPYFVDADAAGSSAGASADQPIGGLTVIAFANSHLAYALTWYALALMVAAAAIGLTMQNARRHDPHRHASKSD